MTFTSALPTTSRAARPTPPPRAPARGWKCQPTTTEVFVCSIRATACGMFAARSPRTPVTPSRENIINESGWRAGQFSAAGHPAGATIPFSRCAGRTPRTIRRLPPVAGQSVSSGIHAGFLRSPHIGFDAIGRKRGCSRYKHDRPAELPDFSAPVRHRELPVAMFPGVARRVGWSVTASGLEKRHAEFRAGHRRPPARIALRHAARRWRNPIAGTKV